MSVKVNTIIHQDCDRSFVMLAKQSNCRQHVLCVDGFGIPRYIAAVDGLVVVSSNLNGSNDFGVCTESQGRNNWSLDPICDALLNKGWSPNHIRMYFLKYEPLWNVIGDWALKPIKPKWDGSREKYLITQVPTAARSIYGPDWAIPVHLEDNGYFRVYVGVPEIYEDSVQLGRLLRAIKSLPHASKMKGVHPAMLATG